MVIPLSVHARLIERFIFNFRLEPDTLASLLPAPYLQPQVFNGWSVVSFCVLKLDQVMLSPLPSFLGFKTISCAYRCGVLDTSGVNPEPSVYITDRNTDLPIISRLGPWVFSDTILMIRPAITQEGDVVTIRVNYPDRQHLFSAEAKLSGTPGKLDSQVFDSIDAFARFMHLGVSSYTPAIYGDALAKVDLYKEEPVYESLSATVDSSWLDGVWRDAGIVFDSAVHASGGLYTWTYRGLSLKDPQEALLRQERLSVRLFHSLQRAKPE